MTHALPINLGDDMKKILCVALLFSAPALAQTVTDGSGTITTGGASQVVFTGNVNRSYLMCQNPVTATETLFVNIDAAASTSAASYELNPGGSVTFITGTAPKGALSVTAATTGHRFVCKAA